MGHLAPLAIITAGIGVAKEIVNAAQVARRTQADSEAQTTATAHQLRQQAQAAEAEERRRQEQLRRERAQRLARFGGQGIASVGGSPEAVLAGMTAESARRGAESAAQRRLAMSGSLLDLADRNRMNLLRAAEARESAALGVAGQIAAAVRGSRRDEDPDERILGRSAAGRPNEDDGTRYFGLA
jgi:hypothetical protein